MRVSAGAQDAHAARRPCGCAGRLTAWRRHAPTSVRSLGLGTLLIYRVMVSHPTLTRAAARAGVHSGRRASGGRRGGRGRGRAGRDCAGAGAGRPGVRGARAGARARAVQLRHAAPGHLPGLAARGRHHLPQHQPEPGAPHSGTVCAGVDKGFAGACAPCGCRPAPYDSGQRSARFCAGPVGAGWGARLAARPETAVACPGPAQGQTCLPTKVDLVSDSDCLGPCMQTCCIVCAAPARKHQGVS